MKVVGFAGYSGAGKTTLLERLIPALKRLGQRVSVVKHAHHKFDIDHPGKDTYRHREAGAFEVVVASDKRLAVMREFEFPVELACTSCWPRCTPRPTGCWSRAFGTATC
jgi:molybdopterin-guanine dinucleotide biosynthesis protein B